jgi:SAM-dependent methyltransferase
VSTTESSAAAFYDQLAPLYHLNYEDWEGAIGRQAAALDVVLRREGVARSATVLDAACGVGTQALGLAALGYRVTASDLSPGAVARACDEAAARGLAMDISVADMREVADHHGRTFDVVMACDNSIPHLLDDAEILAAFRQFQHCTAPGGVCLVTVRDYAAETRAGVQPRMPVVRLDGNQRRIVFQVWDFHGAVYDMALYVVDDAPAAGPTVQVFRSRYYAVGVDDLMRLMREAGFADVRRLDDAFYQPVILGRRTVQGAVGGGA